MRISNILKEWMDIQDIRPLDQSRQEAERITQRMEQVMTAGTQRVIRKYIGKDGIISPDDFSAKSRIKRETIDRYLKKYTPEQCCQKQDSLARFALGLACFWDDIVKRNAQKLQGMFANHEDAIRMAEEQFKQELILAFHQHGYIVIAYHEKGIDLQPFIDMYHDHANLSSRLHQKEQKANLDINSLN